MVSNKEKKNIKTVFGDEKQDKFFPRVKSKQWDNECNFSMGVISTEEGTYHVDNGIYTWSDSEKSAKVYPTDKIITLGDDVALDSEGGVELELILPEKPSTNEFDFSLEFKNVDFLYQGELTTEEIAEGCVRPDHVVGSYAIYRSDKKKHNNNMTGKFGHIYRPVIYDSEGTKVFGELNIQNKTLTVTVPQSFIDNAVYPIVIDPTLGYTTVGGTTDGNWATIAVGPYTLPVDATVDSLTGYFDKGDTTSTSVWGTLYDDNSSLPGDLLSSSSADTSSGFATSGWHTITMPGDEISAQDVYPGVTIQSNTGRLFNYDSSGSTDGYEQESQYTVPDPFGTGTLRSGRLFSIYITYTATATTNSENIGSSSYIQKDGYEGSLSSDLVIKDRRAIGTNIGFCSTSPTLDPEGTSGPIDLWCFAQKDTSPSGSNKVTEIGFWLDNAPEDVGCEVGIYSHDAVNDKPDDYLGGSLVNTTGTSSGWRKITGLDVSLDAETVYWIVVQVDNTTVTTNTNYTTLTGSREVDLISASSMPDPWNNAGTGYDDYAYIFYALYSEDIAVSENIVSDSYILDSDEKNIASSSYIHKAGEESSLSSTSYILDISEKNILSTSYVEKLATENNLTSLLVIEEAPGTTYSDNILSDSVTARAGIWSSPCEVTSTGGETQEANIVSDSTILATSSDNIDSDSSISDTSENNLLSDSYVTDTSENNISSDSTILDTNSSDIDSDSWVAQPISNNLLSDSQIKTTYSSNILSDSYIFKDGTELSISSASYIKKLDNEKNLVSDTHITKLDNENSLASDSFVKKLASDKNLVSDSYILDTNSDDIISDSYIVDTSSNNLDSDLVILSPTYTYSDNILSDSYIFDISTENIGGDSNILKTDSNNLESDSNIFKESIENLGSDSFILKTYTTDDAEITTGLLAHWLLDENPASNGTTLADSYGSYDATLVTNNTTENKADVGQVGGAITFDGDGDYASVSNVHNGANLTINMWVQGSTNYPGDYWGLVKGQGNGYNSGFACIALNTNKFMFRYGDGVSYVRGVITTGILTPTAWNMVTFVLDSSYNISIYVNGVLDISDNVSDIGLISDDYQFATSDGMNPLNGSLDDIQMWNATLTADEIALIYTAGKNSIQSNSYVLDTNSDNITSDSHLLEVFSNNLTSDSEILATTDVNILSNSYIFKEGYEQSLSLASFILDTSDGEMSSDSYITTIDNEKNLVSDSFIMKTTTVGEEPDITNILSHHKFEDNLIDTEGSYNLTTSANIEYSQGRIGKSLSLSGDGYAYRTDSPLGGTGAFTISLWIKTTDNTSAYIISGRDDVSTEGEWVVQLNGSGQIYYWEYIAGSYGHSFTSTATVNDGEWHLVQMVRGTTASAKIYIDNVEEASSTDTNIELLSARYLAVGADVRDEERYITAEIDDIRIYNTDLTSDERERLLLAGANALSMISYIFKESTTNITSDSVILTVSDKNLVSDSYISKVDNTNSLTSDSHILEEKSNSLDSDYNIFGTTTQNILSYMEIVSFGANELLSNYYIKKLDTTTNIGSDSYILKSDNENSIVSDSFIKAVGLTHLSSDYNIKATDSQTIISDSHILDSKENSIESDSRILATGSGEIVSDSFIFKDGEETSISSDSFIKTLDNTVSIVSDSHILESGLANSIDSNLHISKLTEQDISSDLTILASSATSLISDSYIKSTSDTNIDSDSNILELGITKNIVSDSEITIFTLREANIVSDSWISIEYSENILSDSRILPLGYEAPDAPIISEIEYAYNKPTMKSNSAPVNKPTVNKNTQPTDKPVMTTEEYSPNKPVVSSNTKSITKPVVKTTFKKHPYLVDSY